MIDTETQWMIFAIFTLVPAAFIVGIVGGWIADWREAKRIERIFAERMICRHCGRHGIFHGRIGSECPGLPTRFELQ